MPNPLLTLDPNQAPDWNNWYNSPGMTANPATARGVTVDQGNSPGWTELVIGNAGSILTGIGDIVRAFNGDETVQGDPLLYRQTIPRNGLVYDPRYGQTRPQPIFVGQPPRPSATAPQGDPPSGKDKTGMYVALGGLALIGLWFVTQK